MQVTIVGLLTAKSQAEAFNLMTVYDGTGTIEVKEFKDGESDDIQVCCLYCKAVYTACGSAAQPLHFLYVTELL